MTGVATETACTAPALRAGAAVPEKDPLTGPDSARSFGLGEPLAMEAGSARPQCPTASLAAPCRRKRKPGQQTLSTRITDAATSN
jgi:hypothetical protein